MKPERKIIKRNSDYKKNALRQIQEAIKDLTKGVYTF